MAGCPEMLIPSLIVCVFSCTNHDLSDAPHTQTDTHAQHTIALAYCMSGGNRSVDSAPNAKIHPCGISRNRLTRNKARISTCEGERCVVAAQTRGWLRLDGRMET